MKSRRHKAIDRVENLLGHWDKDSNELYGLKRKKDIKRDFKKKDLEYRKRHKELYGKMSFSEITKYYQDIYF